MKLHLFILLALISFSSCGYEKTDSSEVKELYATYNDDEHIAGIGMLGRMVSTPAGEQARFIYLECLRMKDKMTFKKVASAYKNYKEASFPFTLIKETSQNQCKVPVKKELTESNMENIAAILKEKHREAEERLKDGRIAMGVMYAISFVFNPLVTIGSLVFIQPMAPGYAEIVAPAEKAHDEVDHLVASGNTEVKDQIVSLDQMRKARVFFKSLLKVEVLNNEDK